MKAQAQGNGSCRSEVIEHLLPAPTSVTSGRNQVTGLPARHRVLPPVEPQTTYLNVQRLPTRNADPRRQNELCRRGEAEIQERPSN